jgi:hypothetical protein
MFGIGLTTQRIKLSSLKIISHLCTCTNELERSHQRTSQDRTATLSLTSSPAPGIPKCMTPISNVYDGVALVDTTNYSRRIAMSKKQTPK